MHKKELIEKLLRFSESDALWKGQATFARYFASYLENLNIPADSAYDFWRIEPFLPSIAVDAFEHLRTSQDPEIVKFRVQYEGETDHPVPNILDLGKSDILAQGLAIQVHLGFTLAKVLENDYISKNIDAYCNAQKYVLKQTFDKFLRQVYRQGLYEAIRDCDRSGMSGQFGGTTLRTFTTAGRIMFTFAAPNSGNYRDILFDTESSVSFVGQDDDQLCYSAGIQSIHTNFLTALNLIEDVITHWPQIKNSGKFSAKEVSLV